MQQEEKKAPNVFQQIMRVIWECLKRAIVPFVMYLTMSFLLLACMLLEDKNIVLMYILSAVCILGAGAYNAHLCFLSGKTHYDAYLTGCIHRKNARLGIPSGKEHRVEREYRFWKGFLIGFLIGVPVIICASIAGANPASSAAGFSMIVLILFAGWAVIPITWFEGASAFWAMLLIIYPIIISGVFYIVGGEKQKSIKLAEKQRMERVQELAQEQQANRKKS